MSADTLPWLPDTWIAGIAAGDYVERARAGIKSHKVAFTWINKRPDAKGDPCKVMQDALHKVDFTVGGAHDELTDKSYHLLALAVEGHKGASTAISRMGTAFVKEVAGNRRGEALAGRDVGSVRGKQAAVEEVRRAVTGAVNLHVANLRDIGMPDGAQACSCWDAPEGEPGGAKDPYEYPLTDTGNAEQLIDIVDGNMVWVHERDSWLAWRDDLGVWDGSDPGVGMRNARMLAPRVQLAADQRYESLAGLEKDSSDYNIRAKQAGKLTKHAEKCGQASTLRAMLDVARSYPAMVVDGSRFDANPRLLHCADGRVVELTTEGARAREGRRDDYLTRSTKTVYSATAEDPLWASYLARFLPDLELRAFVQRVLGYGLLGANEKRVMVFFHGPTSTGKSTILEAVGAALGEYGGTLPVSVLRAQQNEGPRPDIISVLDKRIVYASEVGSEKHLHADQIKNVTGNETVGGRALYANKLIEKVPAFTPYIATNVMPTISHADEAVWRRLIAVPFDTQIKGLDDDASAGAALRESPHARSAILAWLCAGWDAYVKQGLDNRPDVVIERTRQLQTDASDFHTWFYTKLEVTGDISDYVQTDRLWESWKAYCVSNDIERNGDVNRTMFGRKLDGLGLRIVKGKEKQRIKGASKRVRRGGRWRAAREG